MSDKADRRAWLNSLWGFPHKLSQLNFVYKPVCRVSLPFHRGDQADISLMN